MLDDFDYSSMSMDGLAMVAPHSLKSIIALPDEAKDALLAGYLPRRLLRRFQIDRATFTNPLGEKVVQHVGNPDSGEARITVWRRLDDRDPIVVAEACDTANGRIELTFLMTADPESPRFDVDVDAEGRSTLLGTARRNIAAELAAMEAGLAPGQVRHGLGLVLRDILPQFELFLRDIGHDLILAYPLSYHNAILMERWGFDYIYGRRFMEDTNRRFHKGGDLHALMDGSTPFRRPENVATARGRAWAIHDGILGEPMEKLRMVKRVGHNARARTYWGRY